MLGGGWSTYAHIQGCPGEGGSCQLLFPHVGGVLGTGQHLLPGPGPAFCTGPWARGACPAGDHTSRGHPQPQASICHRGREGRASCQALVPWGSWSRELAPRELAERDLGPHGQACLVQRLLPGWHPRAAALLGVPVWTALPKSRSVTSSSGLRGWLGEDAGPGGREGDTCLPCGWGRDHIRPRTSPALGTQAEARRGCSPSRQWSPGQGGHRGSEWHQLSCRTSPGPGGAGRRDTPTQAWGP